MSGNLTDARAEAQRRYGHGGLHASRAHTEDIMDAFVKGAEFAAVLPAAPPDTLAAVEVALDGFQRAARNALLPGSPALLHWDRLRAKVRALAAAPVAADTETAGLHACEGCGLELDGDDSNVRCEECAPPVADTALTRAELMALARAQVETLKTKSFAHVREAVERILAGRAAVSADDAPEDPL